MSSNPNPNCIFATDPSNKGEWYPFAEMAAILSGYIGGGTVSSILNTDGSLTLTPNPITTTGVVSINTYNSNQWEGQQNFDITSLQNGSYMMFNGTSDENWRIGIDSSFTCTYIGTSTSIQVTVGTGSSGPDGFAIGQCSGGVSIAEFRGYDLATFLNGTLQVADLVTLANLAGSGTGLVAVDNSGNLSYTAISSITPTLDEVLTAGNTANQPFYVNTSGYVSASFQDGLISTESASGNYSVALHTNSTGSLNGVQWGMGSYNGYITIPILTGSRTYNLPDATGTIALVGGSGVGTVTSVALSVPSAFSISGSPITTSGTFTITGAGTTSQFIDGTGALQSIPSLTGYVPYTGATTTINVNSQTLTGGITPVNTTDFVIKSYVDAQIAGLNPKPTAIVGTTTTLPTYIYLSGVITMTSTGVVTIDGHNLALGDIVLVKNETSTNQPYNGLYNVTTAGAVGVACVLTRNSEMNTGTEFSGSIILTEDGTTNAGILWYCTTNGIVVVGTTNITFASLTITVVAGTGISVSGNTISINSSWVGQTAITTVGTINTGVWNGSSIGDSYISSASNWNQAYNKYLVSGSYSGGTITFTTRDASTWTVTGLNVGTVTSVSGTSNRITSSGGNTPIIDISASYIGQGSITTVGTIGTGTWQGTAIADSYIASATNWNTAYTNRIISLTTTGSSGSAALSSNILNIPTYTLAGLGGISLTSLSSTATGLTYTNTTGVFSLTSGYIIPTTTQSTNWTSAYTNMISSLTTTGTSGAATLSGGVLNIPQYSGGSGTVTSVTGTFGQVTVATGTTTPVVSLASGGTLPGAWALGTPVSGNLTNCTFPTLNQNTTGTASNVTGTVLIAHGGTSVTSVTTTPTATSWAGWDANSNLSANNLIEGATFTVTSATPVTLTVASAYQQNFTGSIAQTITMPVVSTLVLGMSWMIMNISTAILTINSSGGSLIQTVLPGASTILECVATTGTTASSWNIMYFSSYASDANLLLASQNTIPATPPAGNLKLYSNNQTSTDELHVIPSVGIESILQNSLGQKQVGTLSPNGNASYLLNGVWTGAFSQNGTVGYTARNYSATNLLPNYSYIRQTTAASTNAGAEWWMFVSSSVIIPGTNTYGNQHKIVVTFGLPTYASTERLFFGIENSAAASSYTTDPSAMINIIGVGKDAGDGTFYFMFNGASGTATKVNTSITPNATDVYRLTIFMPSNFTSCSMTLEDITVSSKTSASTTFSTTSKIPAAGSSMYPHFYVGTGTGSAAVQMAIILAYCEYY